MMSSMARRSVRFGVRLRKLSNLGHWMVTKESYLEFLRGVEGTLSRCSGLQLQSLAPNNPHWAHVVSYGPFSLCVFH
jgi:hypothetical protein